MKSRLVELEHRAFDLMSSGDKDQAVELLLAIVKEQPDWEHGEALYKVAYCFEDLGKTDEARKYYEEAIKHDPNNTIFWGGYASCLYQHGTPSEAFDAYLKLLKLEGYPDKSIHTNDILKTLDALSTKLGLSDGELRARIGKI